MTIRLKDNEKNRHDADEESEDSSQVHNEPEEGGRESARVLPESITLENDDEGNEEDDTIRHRDDCSDSSDVASHAQHLGNCQGLRANPRRRPLLGRQDVHAFRLWNLLCPLRFVHVLAGEGLAVGVSDR